MLYRFYTCVTLHMFLYNNYHTDLCFTPWVSSLSFISLHLVRASLLLWEMLWCRVWSLATAGSSSTFINRAAQQGEGYIPHDKETINPTLKISCTQEVDLNPWHYMFWERDLPLIMSYISGWDQITIQIREASVSTWQIGELCIIHVHVSSPGGDRGSFLAPTLTI